MKQVRTITLLFALLFATAPRAQEAGNPLRDSLRAAREALDHHPDSADLRLRKARWNLELGEWERAREEYTSVLQRHPGNLAAHYYRAYACQRLGLNALARQDYEQVLAQAPTHFEARLGLALLNQQDRRYTEAMDGINALVDAVPDSALAWAARAGMEAERGLWEAAEYDYTQALRRDSDNQDYLLARADSRLRLGRLREGRADLDRLVALGTPRLALREWYDQCDEARRRKK